MGCGLKLRTGSSHLHRMMRFLVDPSSFILVINPMGFEWLVLGDVGVRRGCGNGYQTGFVTVFLAELLAEGSAAGGKVR